MFNKKITGNIDSFIRKAALYLAKNYNPYNTDDKVYWDSYNNNLNESRFDYLTKVGDFFLPMNDRHIPLQRKFIDRLLGQKIRRKFVYSVHADDYNSRKEKYEEKAQNLANSYIDYFMKRSDAINRQILEIQTKKDYFFQMIQQQKQMQEQTGQVLANPQVELQMKIMELEFNRITETANDMDALNNEFIDEYKSIQKLTPFETIESIITKFSNEIEKQIRFEEIKVNQFKAKLVTGKTAFFVGKLYSDKPIILSLDPSSVVFPMDTTTNKIQHRDWAYFIEKMSYAQVIERFIDKLTELNLLNEIESLNKYSRTDNAQMVALPNNDAIMVNLNNFEDASNILQIKHVFFRGSIRKCRKTSVDKYGTEHKHILKDATLINIDDYNYKDRIYTHKNNPNKKYNKSDVSTYSKSKDSIEFKDVESIYYAVVIENNIVIPYGEWKDTIRSVDNYNRFSLPIFGPAYDKVINKPYSLIGATKDIQELYDLMWIAREYMVATAGTKVQLIDKSFKPDAMTDQEWDYQVKLGKLYIQTVTANGTPKNSSFNQWNSFDNSLPQGIQYFDNISESLIQLMGNIIGVSYQSLGEVINTDQVSTNKMAIQQSALVTEIIFWDQEQIEKDVLEEYLSIVLKDKIRDGKDIYFSEYNISNSKNYVLGLKQIQDRDWRIVLYDAGKDMEMMDMLRQYVISQKNGIGISIGEVMKIWNSDTLKEMEYKLEYYENKARKLQQQAASSQIANETNAKKELMQFDTEMKTYIEQIKGQLVQAELQIKKAKDDADIQSQMILNKFEEVRLGIDQEKMKTDRMKVMSDVATEKAMLISGDKHQTVQEQLQYLSIMIDALARGEDIRSYNREIDVKKIAAMKKPSSQHINDN